MIVTVTLNAALDQYIAEGGQPARLARYTANCAALLGGMRELGFHSFLAEDIQAREYDKAMPMMSRDLRFRPKALEALSRSFVELEVLPAAPDMKTLYTEQFIPAPRS